MLVWCALTFTNITSLSGGNKIKDIKNKPVIRSFNSKNDCKPRQCTNTMNGRKAQHKASTPECSLDDWGGATHWGGATRVAPPTPNSIGL